MSSNYNEDYLNGLIAKAKKSWEGVDVDSYMSELRDNLSDKEVAEELSKKVTSYITEQIKSNMNTVTIKCKELQFGDWCCSGHGLPMQITNVGDDYAYATWEGNEGDPWEFDDKDEQPQPIEITSDILMKNGWKEHSYTLPHNLKEYFYVNDEKGIHLVWKRGTLSIWFACNEDNDGIYSDIVIPVKYVHQLQQVLRLAGLTDMANNFKVWL